MRISKWSLHTTPSLHNQHNKHRFPFCQNKWIAQAPIQHLQAFPLIDLANPPKRKITLQIF